MNHSVDTMEPLYAFEVGSCLGRNHHLRRIWWPMEFFWECLFFGELLLQS